MGIVETFEEDCVSRIEARRANIASVNVDGPRTFPAASLFLMGLSFGVIVARVAGVCRLFKTE